MKYDDFASLVQLGVGLHIGTAILQLYGEIGLAPVNRTLERARNLILSLSDEDLSDELAQLESEFAVFRIKLFNEMKIYTLANSVVALILIIILLFISFLADRSISPGLAVWIAAVSILPAPITLGVLWCNASREVGPLKQQSERLESQAIEKSI